MSSPDFGAPARTQPRVSVLILTYNQERFISQARHIEVQIFGDGKGHVVALGDPNARFSIPCGLDYNKGPSGINRSI